MKAIAIRDWKPTTEDIVIIDIRPTEEFIYGFIPNSIHIPMEKLAKYTPLFVKDAEKVILIAAETADLEKAASILLAHNPKMDISYLENGWNDFIESDFESDMIIEIEADEFAMDQQFDENMVVIDVRTEDKYDAEHVVDAVSIPMDQFTDILNIAAIEEDKNVYIHCGGGSSAVMTASLFKRHGLHNVRTIEGGFAAMQALDKIKTEKTKKK